MTLQMTVFFLLLLVAADVVLRIISLRMTRVIRNSLKLANSVLAMPHPIDAKTINAAMRDAELLGTGFLVCNRGGDWRVGDPTRVIYKGGEACRENSPPAS